MILLLLRKDSSYFECTGMWRNLRVECATTTISISNARNKKEKENACVSYFR
jgi:hypothetical protein